ncbi:MAG: Dabb family protein [Ruminococcus sp.]
MMDSLFTDNEALKAYQKHPLHLEVANGLVRPNVDVRLSFDFEV